MTIDLRRRLLLRGVAAGGLAGTLAAAGLLAPRQLLAAWERNIFESRSIDEALKQGYGSTTTATSDQILLKAPDVAEDGSTVKVSVDASQLPEVESIAILASSNPRPLCGVFQPVAGVRPKFTTRIKMSKTSDVIAVVKSGGKLYTAKRNVKVTIGGCG